MSLTLLSVGSNVGNKKENLERAISEISQVGKVLRVSSYYETKPYGYHEQPDFLNCAVIVETFLEPEKLLIELKRVETVMGREKNDRWRERIIDIDIIFYNSLVLETRDLKIPHADMQYREFVLKPLAEIAPDFIHPIIKKTIRELLEALPYTPFVDFIPTPEGNFYMAALGTKVNRTSFSELKGRRERNEYMVMLKRALQTYFNGERVGFEEFTIDDSHLTDFQKKVYTYLRTHVTWGKTISYGELAQKVGTINAARAVGNAMAKNPFPIIVPCHRVLKRGNKLGGFSGGEHWKKYLLTIEGVTF